MKLATLDKTLDTVASWLRSPLLLILRLYWGIQFMQTGWGKLTHLDRTAGYFASLHLPAPHIQAAMAGGTEMLGGILLAAGLLTRWACIPLTVLLCVAYATAEHDALVAITSDPDKFTSATPFLFLLAVLVVLAFGPGLFSIDAVLKRGAKDAKA